MNNVQWNQWVKGQIKYIPEYIKGLEHSEDLGKSLQNVLTDNLDKFMNINEKARYDDPGDSQP